MELRTPLRLLRRALLSPRRTDAFRSRIECFITQSFIHSYLATPRCNEAHRLLPHGRKVYSQNDEDGIIAEIFHRIGTDSRRFIEIGAADGLENNTVWLLLQGWSGTWIEGNPTLAATVRNKFTPLIDDNRLMILNEFATPESVRRLDEAAYFKNIDLLSLDIDGNDYHIIEPIKNIRARLIVVEYNGKFPPPHEFVMPYNANYSWDLTDYCGASLTSWNKLLRTKGYSLVGCNITGANAFFVRNDLVPGQFCEPFTPENHYEPARYWLTSGFVSGHAPNFGDGHGHKH